MSCQRCESDRILSMSAKHSDLWDGSFKGKDHDGYAPDVTGICGGDYTFPHICLECGQVQGKFPVDDPDFGDEEDEEDRDFTS